MDLTKILFAAMVFFATSTLAAATATNSTLARTSMSQTQILVKLLIIPRVANATAQVLY